MPKNKFKRFMLKEGAWATFRENYDSQFLFINNVVDVDGFLDWFFAHESNYCLSCSTPISLAFDWGKSQKGREYWYGLHEKYKKKVN